MMRIRPEKPRFSHLGAPLALGRVELEHRGGERGELRVDRRGRGLQERGDRGRRQRSGRHRARPEMS
jgi:hypothetical protein